MRSLRAVGLAAGVVSALLLVVAFNRGESPRELEQSGAVTQWLATLKGAESFLDDADNGKLPAKGIVPQSLTSVERLLKQTVMSSSCSYSELNAVRETPCLIGVQHSQKEQVHREATRLSSLQTPAGNNMPYGARKVAIAMGPHEKNKEQGFRESARAELVICVKRLPSHCRIASDNFSSCRGSGSPRCPAGGSHA